MANAATKRMFANKQKVDTARKTAVKTLKAPPGTYYGRLLRIGMKDNDKNESMFYCNISLICDKEGNMDCLGEQAGVFVTVRETERKSEEEMMAKVVEAMDKLGFNFPDSAEQLDADFAELNAEKPFLKVSISEPEGFDRKFLNLQGNVSIEDLETAFPREDQENNELWAIFDDEESAGIDENDEGGETAGNEEGEDEGESEDEDETVAEEPAPEPAKTARSSKTSSKTAPSKAAPAAATSRRRR